MISSTWFYFPHHSVLSLDYIKSIVNSVSLNVFDNCRMYYSLLGNNQVQQYQYLREKYFRAGKLEEQSKTMESLYLF